MTGGKNVTFGRIFEDFPSISIRGDGMLLGGIFRGGPIDFDPTRAAFLVMREDHNPASIYDEGFVARYRV